MSEGSRERTEALRRVIIKQVGDDASTISLIKHNLDLLGPEEFLHTELLWDAVIVSNRCEVVQAMIDHLGASIKTSMVLNKAAQFNRANLFRLFLEQLHPTVFDLGTAIESARTRGFVEIIQTAIECGVSQDALVFGNGMASSLIRIHYPGRSQSYELQKYHSVLEVCAEHNLLNATAFELFMFALWDCAQCEQIANLCLDHLGFDPCWNAIEDAISIFKEKSVWWLCSPMRIWDLRDSARQSRTDLMSVLSVYTLRPTKHAIATQSMWEVAKEVASFDVQALLPPGKTTMSSKYRNTRDFSPVEHFVRDGNLRMLLICWPYLAKYLSPDKDDDQSVQPSPPAVAGKEEALRKWLCQVRSHPAVQIALTCHSQHNNCPNDMRKFFKKVFQSIVDANYEAGPWKQTFNEVCGQSLLWLLGFDSDLAEVFLDAVQQAVPAFFPSGDPDHSATVLGVLISGRLHCLEYEPVQSHLRFLEHHIASLSGTCYRQVVLSSTPFVMAFGKVIRNPQVDVSFLEYFLSAERTKGAVGACIQSRQLWDAMVEVLEQADPTIEQESFLAMKKFTWMAQYAIQNYGKAVLQQMISVAHYSRVVRSRHTDAMRLLQQHGALSSPQQMSNGQHRINETWAFVAACETGNLAVAEMIAEAVYEREGAQGWLSLFDRHSAVYTAEIAAEIHGHVHLQHWLRDLQQRAREMVSGVAT